jgi:thioredoxin-dependent peroxiredoxin
MIEIGTELPEFALQDEAGRAVRSDALRGRPLVLFAYPRADTPGCTKEACAFRDLAAEFGALGVQVYGLSADKIAAQQKFAAKYGLTIPLLSDPDRQLLTALGAWGEKVLYGKKSMGIVRSTFLFDRDGVLRERWPKVKVEGHADAVLARAKALVGAPR